MIHVLTLTLLMSSPASVRALPLDKPLASHCGALLLGAAHDRPAPREEFVAHLQRYVAGLGVPSSPPDLRGAGTDAEVQTLALQGWEDQDRLARSAARLAKLGLDLDRWSEVTSVTFAIRGEEIPRFLARLDGQTARLDRETFRQAARAHLKLSRLTLEAVAATALLLGGWQSAQALAPSLAGVFAQTSGIVAAAYVAREPARRLYDFLVPPRLLDVGRLKIDSHLRVIAEHGLTRAHIGLTAPVSRGVIEEFLRARAANELDPARLAGLLLESARNDERGGELLVDHVSLRDEGGEPLLLSAVRVVKPRVSEGARGKDARWTRANARPVPQPAFARAR